MTTLDILSELYAKRDAIALAKQAALELAMQPVGEPSVSIRKVGSKMEF